MGLERVPLPGRHSGLKEEATFLIESKQKVLYSFLHLSLKMEHSGGEKSASSVFQVTSPAPESLGREGVPEQALGRPCCDPQQQRPPQQGQEIVSQV